MTNIPANIPKLDIGIKLENPVVKKEIEVVEEVESIALAALLQVRANLLL